MLRHAARQGVHVIEETRVEGIEFAVDGIRPIAATWRNKAGASGRIAFEWLNAVLTFGLSNADDD